MRIWQTRMQQRHDIPDNWKKSSLVLLAGEIAVYDDRYIDSEGNIHIVAESIRYKIGNGVTPVNELPFADTSEVLSKINELNERIEEVASNGGILALTPVDGTIVINDVSDGEKSIGVAIAPAEGNALVAVEGGLFVPQLLAGTGIEVSDNKINIKLADTTHGLVAVEGKLTINLATRDSDGAMSKEDKAFIEDLRDVSYWITF